jgi:hypothetical protein
MVTTGFLNAFANTFQRVSWAQGPLLEGFMAPLGQLTCASSCHEAAGATHTLVCGLLGRPVNDDRSIQVSRTLSAHEKANVSEEAETCQRILYELRTEEGRRHCFPSGVHDRPDPSEHALQDAAIGVVTGLGVCDVYAALSCIAVKVSAFDGQAAIVNCTDHRWALVTRDGVAATIDGWKHLMPLSELAPIRQGELHNDRWPGADAMLATFAQYCEDAARLWTRAPGITPRDVATARRFVERRLQPQGWGSFENRALEADALRKFQEARLARRRHGT